MELTQVYPSFTEYQYELCRRLCPRCNCGGLVTTSLVREELPIRSTTGGEAAVRPFYTYSFNPANQMDGYMPQAFKHTLVPIQGMGQSG